MNYTQVKAGLPKIMQRSDIIERAERVIEDINQHVLPNWRTAADVWKTVTPSNPTSKALIGDVMRGLKGRGGFADRVLQMFENASQILPFVSEYSRKVFATSEASMGMSYSKITLLRCLQAADFAAKYSRSLLNFICYLETNKDARGEGPVKKEIEFIMDNTRDFCSALMVFDRDVAAFEKHLKALPDATVDDKTENTFGVLHGFNAIDPMGLRNFAVTWNPFYHVALMVAEYQATSYKEAEEETRLLQQRLLQLQQMHDGGHADASVEVEIDNTQDRISNLKYKLAQMEKDYGL